MASPPSPPTPAAWVPYRHFSDLLFVSATGHIAFGAFFGLFYGQPLLALSLCGSGLLVGSLFPLLRSRVSARLARSLAHAALLVNLLATSVSLIWIGLSAEVSVWWLVWWPMFVAHILGTRDGLAWVPVTLLTAAGIWANDQAGWLTPLMDASQVPMIVLQAGFLLIGAGVGVVVRRAFDGYHSDIGRQQRIIQSQQQSLADRANHLEEMLQALQQANLERTRLFAQLSHEVRTPLNGVLGFAQLLERTPLDAQQARHVQQINQCGDTLLQLVNEVLDFSRLEARHTQIECRGFDALVLAQEAMDMVSPTATHKGVTLHMEHDGGPADELMGDPLRIKQVMLNLLANAVKFTDNGQVTLRCHWSRCPTSATLLRVEVQDSGIGVPASAIPHLFKPFCEASDHTIQRYGGSGLGLAICKRLVDMMGGDIGVSSEPGQGSLFWFSVPVGRREGACAAQPARSEATPAGL